MSFNGALEIVPGLQAGADLSSNQFHFVKPHTTALQVVQCNAGQDALGVQQDKTGTAGRDVAVGFKGVTKIVAGAAFSVGDRLMSDATGRGITATVGGYVKGRALEAATAAGDVVSMLFEARDEEAASLLGLDLKMVTVDVTATQIRTAAAIAIPLVAAPGVGKSLIFLGMSCKFLTGAVGYDSVGAGEDLTVKYTDASGEAVSLHLDTTTDIDFNAVADDEAWIPALAAVVNPVENAILIWDNVGAGELADSDADSDGDGTVQLKISYYEWTL